MTIPGDTLAVDGAMAMRERCIQYAIDALRGRAAIAQTDDVVEIAKAIETYIAGGQKENGLQTNCSETVERGTGYTASQNCRGGGRYQGVGRDSYH